MGHLVLPPTPEFHTAELYWGTYAVKAAGKVMKIAKMHPDTM